MTLSRRLVWALAGGRDRPIAADVRELAALHPMDAVGVGLAAAGSSVGEPYRRAAPVLADTGRSSLLGSGATGSCQGAALINGGLIHSLEFDDTHTASIVHGSALVAATALAVGQDVEASGAAVLGAFVRGWEVFIRLGLAAPGSFQAQGFQITGVGGALVSALVASDLLGLGENESVHAVGIALSQASGVFEFLTNGSSVKSLHPGWAAHAGIVAARFAQAGLTGPETALEGRHGLFRRFAADEQAAERFGALIATIETDWRLREAAFKLHPCCHYLHPFIEAAARLRAGGVRADAIASVVCRIAAGGAPIVCEPWAAKQAAQGHEARWSLPVATAAAFVTGGVGLDTFEGPMPDPVRRLAQRIRWEPLQDARFPERFEAELIVESRDGHVETLRVDDVYGNASRPARRDDILAKFRANVARSLSPTDGDALEHALLGIEALPSLEPIGSLLDNARPSVVE